MGIERELELKRHGLKLLKPMASSFTPTVDGRYLLLGQSDEQDHLEISKFSKRDADAYFRYSMTMYSAFFFLNVFIHLFFQSNLKFWKNPFFFLFLF